VIIAGMKSNDEFPTPIIFPITRNVLIHENLMLHKQIMKISTKICKKIINKIHILNGNRNILKN
jgi:hypothetical protein